MEATSVGASRTFFDKWFTALKSPSGLPRVHDKKLSIMTMCALLEMDPTLVPAPLQDGWAGIVSAILHVFQGLPEAEESRYFKLKLFQMLTCATERKALEDALKDDLEEDDEDDSAEALLNLQDDDGNIEFAISVWHVLIINH